MNTSPKKPFNLRAFVSFLMFFSGIGLPISGAMIHTQHSVPVSSQQPIWNEMHGFLALLFIAGVVWHLVLNRRALLNYLKGAIGRIPAISREAVYAVMVVAFVTFLCVGHSFHGTP